MFAKTTANRPGLPTAALLIFSLALMRGEPAQAQATEQRFSTMKDGMSALANEIQRQLIAQGQNTLAIKTFEGPAGTSSSSRIAQALTEQLKGLSPTVGTTTAPGNWSVAGNFFVDQNQVSGRAEIFIESTLKNPQGRPHAKLLTPIITDDKETLTMFGVTATLPTAVTPQQAAAGKDLAEVRADAVVQAIDKPQVAVQAPAAGAVLASAAAVAAPPTAIAPPATGTPPAGATPPTTGAPPAGVTPPAGAAPPAAGTPAGAPPAGSPPPGSPPAVAGGPGLPAIPSLVKAAPQSPFAMEVLIGGKPIAGAVQDGAAFVGIPKDAIYEIRLYNNSDQDVGVTLTIDGINTLVFSRTPGFKEVGKWVIGRRSTGLIRGWHIEGPVSKSFKVMDYGESAAAQFAATKDIGTITAVFCGAFNGPLPLEEATALAGAKGQLATGFGPDVEQKHVPVQRTYGLDRAAISIRYAKPDESDLPPAEAAPPAAQLAK